MEDGEAPSPSISPTWVDVHVSKARAHTFQSVLPAVDTCPPVQDGEPRRRKRQLEGWRLEEQILKEPKAEKPDTGVGESSKAHSTGSGEVRTVQTAAETPDPKAHLPPNPPSPILAHTHRTHVYACVCAIGNMCVLGSLP